MAKSFVKYTEFFAANGATTVAVSSTGTTITLSTWPSGLTATNWSGYKIWFSPSLAGSQSASLTGANPTAKTITINAAFTVSSTQSVWVGKPISPTAGMSQFYLRSAVIKSQGEAIRFATASRVSSTPFTVAVSNSVASALIKFSPAVPNPVPNDISTATIVNVGGNEELFYDSLTFVDVVTKKASAVNTDSIAFAQTVSANKTFPRNVVDSLSLGQAISNQATLTATVVDSITLAHSESGHSPLQYINTYEAVQISESAFATRQIIFSSSDSISFYDVAVLPPISFTTPLTQVVPPILPETMGPSYRLFRHYAPTYRHVNVFLLNDGTFVQDYPTPENNNANVPYPWNWNEPNAPYAVSTNWNGIISQYYLNPHISQVFWGGETSLVNQNLANALRHAGYGNYLTVGET